MNRVLILSHILIQSTNHFKSKNDKQIENKISSKGKNQKHFSGSNEEGTRKTGCEYCCRICNNMRLSNGKKVIEIIGMNENVLGKAFEEKMTLISY